MKILGLGRYLLCGIAAAAMLAGCGGSQPPMSAPGAMPQSRAIVAHANRGGSWMLPEAKNGDLLYLADQGSPTGVSVYSFPKLKLVGQLTSSRVTGECVDSGGNVYLVEFSQIVEYAHGGASPIKTIQNPYNSNQYFWSCAVDNNTGNLAVVDADDSSKGTVLIYHNATGTPSSYFIGRNVNPFYCAYDTSSDLLVLSAPVLNYGRTLFVLASGAKELRRVQIGDPRDVNPTGGIQWDNGQFVFAGESAVVLRYALNHSKRRIAPKGQTPVAGSSQIGQFWIQDGRIVVPSEGSNSFNIYKYPSGVEIASMAGSGGPTAAVVSAARKPLTSVPAASRRPALL
jgi:hypothetical protein